MPDEDIWMGEAVNALPKLLHILKSHQKVKEVSVCTLLVANSFHP
jgi:hypothetical protein